MKLASIPSRRQAITIAIEQVRNRTLDLLAEIEINESWFYSQAHPDFSPIGWHFGHIAFTEAYWILEYLGGLPAESLQYNRLFAADGLPKQERQNLPTITVIQDYLSQTRAKVLDYLATAPIKQQERLWQWLIQHESQHSETITLIWQLHQQQRKQNPGLEFDRPKLLANSEPKFTEMLEVEEGEFIMGSDRIIAQDNERPSHKVRLRTYWIDRYPVTCGQYHQFMLAGGYQKPQYWSLEGWQWLQQNPVAQPLYWCYPPDWRDRPVCGVSYYEAEAYSNFVGRRLPTEAEWEKASLGASSKCNHSGILGATTPVNAYPDRSQYGCQDMLGNVWEWTADWFAGYEGFSSYPYSGYSEVYFDRQHRVLKGGSWATHSAGLRTSFRNWYHPHVRQIFAGFRCVSSTPR